jgi:hypothetical protein
LARAILVVDIGSCARVLRAQLHPWSILLGNSNIIYDFKVIYCIVFEGRLSPGIFVASTFAIPAGTDLSCYFADSKRRKRKEQEQDRKAKKMRNPKVALADSARQLWEQFSQRAIDKEKRYELMDEFVELTKGRMLEVCLFRLILAAISNTRRFSCYFCFGT